MNFISTRGGEKATAAQAILKGFAKDGGMFVPEKFPVISQEEMNGMAEMSYPERVAFIIGKYFAEDFGVEFLQKACEEAFATFEGKDPVPLMKIDGEMYVLELFHGPTCADKDMSMTLFPALLKKSCEIEKVKEDALVLVSTSGDTGKAAMECFRDKKGVKVAVFYPEEGVAKMQRLQLGVQDGDNLNATAIKGNYEDCRRAVNRIFESEDLKQALAEKKTFLTTANSANFARIAPQIAYYFSAYLDLVSSDQIEMGEKIDFVAPTGSFGNILAGWYAKQMGLPIRKLVCASNRNKTLADFFNKGTYDAKRTPHRTMSPSMDVVVAANIERLIFETSGRNAKMTAERMKLLAEKKEFSLTTPEKQRLDEEFFAGFSSEDDTIEAMYEVFDEYGYAMDTHTGVGLAIYAQYKQTIETEDKKDKTPIVVFATGNPYKFPQDVLYALSGNDVKDSFKGIKRLNLLTAMKPPKCLLGLRYRPERFKKKISGDVKETTAEILRFVDGEIVPVPDQK